MRKILAVIVTYNPVKEDVVKAISGISDGVDKIMVWENGPGSLRDDDIFNIGDKIMFAPDGDIENRGLAYPYNRALEYGKEHDYEFLLIMDQDSCWTGFEEYKKLVISHGETAVYCPARPLKSSYFATKEKADPAEAFSETFSIINSGLMCKIKTLIRVGGFCEKFFVDGVDEELMCRLYENNIKAYFVSGNFRFEHKLGYVEEHYLSGKKFTSPGYSPFRLRDRYKSMILLRRLHPRAEMVNKRIYHDWVKINMIRILIGEKGRFKKMMAILRGFISGMTTKLK